MKIKVAGTKFYDLEESKAILGMLIELRKEANNKFDSNAIEVWCNNYKIGYIPKNMNTNLDLVGKTYKVSEISTFSGIPVGMEIEEEE
jgi:hypothetical protein